MAAKKSFEGRPGYEASTYPFLASTKALSGMAMPSIAEVRIAPSLSVEEDFLGQRVASFDDGRLSLPSSCVRKVPGPEGVWSGVVCM